MSDPDRPALQRAWPIICQLINLLQIYVPRLTPEAPQRWRMLHMTRLAESLVRRWLVLKACVEGNWPNVRMAPRSPASPNPVNVSKAPAPSNRLGSNPAPFRLAEPEPRMPVWVHYAATETQPGGWWLEYPPTMSAIAPPQSPNFNPVNLQRRCAALSDVMTDPDTHVARMAHWLARAAAQGKSGFAVRAAPLQPGSVPGASRQQLKRDPERQNMLSWLDYLAHQAVPRGGSP